MFFKHFPSKNQLPGLSISGTLIDNVLIVGEIKSVAVVPRCSVRKVFLEVSQNSQVFSYEFCGVLRILVYLHEIDKVFKHTKFSKGTVIFRSKPLPKWYN